MLKNCLIFKLTGKNQVVVPSVVQKQLGLRPGDLMRYRMRGKQAVIEKVTLSGSKDNPFIAFDEWASVADDKAFADL